MLEQQLLHTIPGLQLRDLTLADAGLVFELATVAPAAACPLCGQPSARVHSRYSRHPADLPWADYVVHYLLQVRRFFCDNPCCARRIFAERFGPALCTYARRTTLLATRFQQLGLTAGGAVGAALATLVGTPISPSTMLPLIRAADLPALPTPRVLSMDDFAFRKGQTYGTILVDLERHYPVDLLPDREPATVTAWLRDHPGVEIISRDRASGYAQAARDGAPDAIQVADRFHLLCNLGDALQRLLDRHPAALSAVTEQLAQLAAVALDGTAARSVHPQTTSTSEPLVQPQVIAPTGWLPEQHSGPQTGQGQGLMATDRPQERDHEATSTLSAAAAVMPGASPAVQRRFAAIKELQARGCGQRAISRQLDLNRRTVRRYMVVEQPPTRAHGRQSQSRAHAYLPYLRRRWAEGCHNAVLLWKELQQEGFTGSYNSIYRLLVQRIGPPSGSGSGPRKGTARNAGTPEPQEVRPLTARQARWLLAHQPSALAAEEEQQRALLCAASPAVARAYELAQRFAALIREGHAEGLDQWIGDAKGSGVAEMRNFAIGIQRDQAAVLGALSLPWSHERVAYCTPSPRS